MAQLLGARSAACVPPKSNDTKVSHLLQDSRRDTFALTGSSVRRSFLESV
jgi:hypothetical protein